MHAGPSGGQRAERERESSEWSSNDERWDAETLPNLDRRKTKGPLSEQTPPPQLSENEWDTEDEIPLSIIREKLRETKECTVVLHHFEFIEMDDSSDLSSSD